MPYDDLTEPPEPIASFGADDSTSAQATAAVLLALGWQLSGEPNLADLSLDEDAGYVLGVLPSAPEPRVFTPRQVAQGVLREMGSDFREGRTGELRQRLIELYRGDPSSQIAAALFEACLHHNDELVRVAAAASYIEIATEIGSLLDVLAGGTRSEELLVRDVAATALGRVAPEHPALDHPWGTSSETESTGQLETSLIVHGTFARRASWWQPGGDFHTYILDNVRGDLYLLDDRYEWSGGYSDGARALAAEELVDWTTRRGGTDVDIFAHSHGGNVAMLATHSEISVGTLVLLSVPVHWHKYFPRYDHVRNCVSMRVHADLVILADRGAQRFRDPRVSEHVLPIWFKHPATHDPATWRRLRLDQYI
jgi:hypothetical protein